MRVGSVSELGLSAERVAEFYAQRWHRKVALLDRAFYDWQFKAPPLSLGLDSCVVAYDPDKDVIAGAMGVHPRPFHVGGRVVRGGDLTTWFVDDAYRGVGIGVKIMAYMQANYQLLIAMGVSSMSLPIFMRSGFRLLRAIPRFVRVYDAEVVGAFGKFERLAQQLAAEWAEQPTVDYTATPSLGSDAFFARCAESYNLAARDPAHLRWRYADHPLFEYRTFMVRPKGQEAEALVALRIEASVPGLRLVHVTDCLGDDAAMPAAFSFIDDYCRQEGAHVADFFSTAAKVNKHPLSRGWFSVLDDECLQFPHLFHPVEIRSPATTSLAYWTCDDMTELCDLSRLYISKQDADFDRPVFD